MLTLNSLDSHESIIEFIPMKLTYSELLDYFTEEELDDAAIIARFAQHDFPHMTYSEIYIQILREMVVPR